MQTEKLRVLVLVFCVQDERLWVYDQASGVNHLIPLTNFYNELMLHAKVRDPAVALNMKRLFVDLEHYSDTALAGAFASYNKLKTKIHFDEELQIAEEPRPSLFRRIRSRLLKQH